MPSILSIFDRKDTNRIVDIPTEKIVPSKIFIKNNIQ